MKARDLTGRKFGRLTVLKLAGKIGRNAASLCRCKCGTEKVILNLSLLGKHGTKSCGCLSREKASLRVKENPPRLKHGLRSSLTYNSWQGMAGRCSDKDNEVYGGRGITVHPRYADMDKGIVHLVEDIGHRPSKLHSLDRIDGDKGYEPGNLRWATREQQNQNTRMKKSNTSGYKGVVGSCDGPWRAEIKWNGNRAYLGSYETKEEAALAYNLASEKLQGEYGLRNQLPKLTEVVKKNVAQKVQSILSRRV